MMSTRYDIEIGADGELNNGFWGKKCGSVRQQLTNTIHEYMEDSISVNHGESNKINGFL